MGRQQLINYVEYPSDNLLIGTGVACVLLLLLIAVSAIGERDRNDTRIGEPSGAYYVIALLFPWLAFFLIGRPIAALVSILLSFTIILHVFVLIWSLFAVADYNRRAAATRDFRLARMIGARQPQDWPAMTE